MQLDSIKEVNCVIILCHIIKLYKLTEKNSLFIILHVILLLKDRYFSIASTNTIF